MYLKKDEIFDMVFNGLERYECTKKKKIYFKSLV